MNYVTPQDPAIRDETKRMDLTQARLDFIYDSFFARKFDALETYGKAKPRRSVAECIEAGHTAIRWHRDMILSLTTKLVGASDRDVDQTRKLIAGHRAEIELAQERLAELGEPLALLAAE